MKKLSYKYYIPGLMVLIAEMGVSGYYTPIDFLWFFIRIMIILVYCSAALIRANKFLSWLSIVIIPLTLMSARNEWNRLATDKLNASQKLEQTKIIAPVRPVLPECTNLIKWRKEVCDSRVEKLQLAYNGALEKYNTKIEQSENRIKAVDIDLTFSESSNVFLYIMLSCLFAFLAMLATPRDRQELRNEKVVSKKRLDEDLKKMSVRKILKDKIKYPKKSYESICKENGTPYKNFVRWRKEIVPKIVLNSTQKGLEERLEENEQSEF